MLGIRHIPQLGGSSDLSPQSFCPSHTHPLLMHKPFGHLNSVKSQLRGSKINQEFKHHKPLLGPVMSIYYHDTQDLTKTPGVLPYKEWG